MRCTSCVAWACDLNSLGPRLPIGEMGLGWPGPTSSAPLEQGDPCLTQTGAPPHQLTGGQGCHGGGDQALDAQGAEGAP